MSITANDTKRKSWLEVPENSDFPIKIFLSGFLTKKML
jgi:fumarylacetoacetase